MFEAAFDKLNEEQLNWKPHDNVWSIAQNIEHIIIINETYFPIFDAIYHNTYAKPFLSRISFIPSILGSFILKSVQPDRKNKIKTFPIWEPNRSSTGIINVLIEHHKTLITNIERINDRKLEKIIISSPANRHIVYSLSKALEIIATHEKRHLEQAKEILQIIPN